MKKLYICPKMYLQQMNPTDVLMNSGINLSDSDDPDNPNPIIDGAKDRDEEFEIEIQETSWGNLW